MGGEIIGTNVHACLISSDGRREEVLLGRSKEKIGVDKYMDLILSMCCDPERIEDILADFCGDISAIGARQRS